MGLLEERLVAMGALKRIDSVTGEIKRMRVVPDYQRRGYGTAILLALEQRADELGISRLKLDTTDIQLAAQSLSPKRELAFRPLMPSRNRRNPMGEHRAELCNIPPAFCRMR